MMPWAERRFVTAAVLAALAVCLYIGISYLTASKPSFRIGRQRYQGKIWSALTRPLADIQHRGNQQSFKLTGDPPPRYQGSVSSAVSRLMANNQHRDNGQGFNLTKGRNGQAATPGPTGALGGCMDLNNLDRDKALVLGHRRKDKGILTIGVTSAKRANASYLYPTLAKLIEGASPEELAQLSIVVFACDFAEADRKEVTQVVESGFGEHLASGLLQVVEAPRSFYPSLEGMKRTFGDPAARVRWRAKETLDVAFLMAYSRSLSHYYMLMDDDLATKPGYLEDLGAFIDRHRNVNWIVLDASSMGTCKVFRDEDLGRVARFLIHFYQEQPVDWLIKRLISLQGQQGHYLIQTMLFKHLGYVSTLSLHNEKSQDSGEENR